MPLIRLLLRLYNLYLSPERDFARRVRELVGFAPARLSIFRLAFAHKSNQRVDRATGQSSSNNNERLEYLGDAVLGTIVAEYLFKKYPDTDEGFLTKMRSKIVKRKSLNAIGDEMGLDVFLTELNRVRLSSSMLGNAVEALCGAVYLERGYEGTKRFVIRRMLRPYVDIHTLETTDDNYKSQLLEHCQKHGKTVAYRLVDKFKRDRRDRFRVAVVVGGQQIAEADDFNKKAAEQLASRRALELLGAVDAAAAPSVKASAKTAKPAKPKKVAKPEKRQPAPAGETAAPARRSTGISRAIYHATRTAAAALVSLEHVREGQADAATAPEPVTAPTPPAPTKRSSANKEPTERPGARARRESPRALPARLLTPIVKHAAAVLAIDFAPADLAKQAQPSPPPPPAPRLAARDDDWANTPLELVPVEDAKPRRRRGRRDKYDWVVSRDWVDAALPPR